MSTIERERLVEKIQKLLAKAKGTDSQQEAELFMAKANELLIQHNLSITDIDVSEDGITHEEDALIIGEIKEEGTWEKYLIASIAEHNMCSAINHPVRGQRRATVTIIGEVQSIEITKYMFEAARDAFRRISKATYNKMRKEALEEYSLCGYSELELQRAKILPYRMPFIRSFLKGCVTGLHHKIKQMIEQSVQSAGTEDEYALMVVNNNQLIKQYQDNLYDDVKDATGQMKVEQTAFLKGVQIGNNHNLTVGISGTTDESKLVE